MKARPQPKKNVVVMSQRSKLAASQLERKKSSPIISTKRVLVSSGHCLGYKDNKLSNFSQKRLNKRFFDSSLWLKIKRGGLIAVIVLIIGGTSYGLFCSAYFRVSQIEIEGNQLISANELQSKLAMALSGRFWQIWQGNFWLTRANRLCNQLVDYSLADCRLSRHWPNKFTIKIQEEPVVAIWQEDGWYYWVNRFGRVVKQEQPNEASAKLFSVIENKGTDSLMADRQVLINQLVWPMIGQISQADWPEKTPQKFNFNSQEPNSLEVVAENQQIIKLTLRRDLSQQLELWQAGRGKFGQQLSQAQVIDLRYGDRIIYQ